MKKLIFFVAVIFLMTASSSCSNSGSKQKEISTEKSTIQEVTLAVEGSCGMCKTKIEKTATEIEGVTAADWDAEAKILTFSYDAAKTSPEAVSKAIAGIGYDTELDKATDEVYDALPGCCKYRS